MTDFPDFMARHGETLIDNGYSILPIQAGVKSPGRYTNGVWSNYPDWSRHCDRPTTEIEVGIWAQWPGCAIGIAAGTVCGVDIDIHDAEVAHLVEVKAREMLGNTPCVRIGLPPKRLLVYRTSQPFRSRKTKPLEILCHGTQFVAYGIHPDTGRPYQWPHDGMVETDISALPEVDEAAVVAFYEAAWEIIPASMKSGGRDPNAVPSLGPGFVGGSIHGARGTPQAIRAALDYIPNDDLDRADWVAMGMSIKGALGEAGRDVWLDWSRASGKSGASGKTDTPERAWRSFRPHSRGAGSIYFRAMQNGWSVPPELDLNGDLPTLEEAKALAAGLLAGMKRAPVQIPEPKPEQPPAPTVEAPRLSPRRATADDIPAELMDVGGVLGEFVAHCNETAFRRQPFLALAAGVCLMGALAGRQYRSHTNLRTNVYAVGIAESGGGKDHAPDVARTLLTAAGLAHYMGGEDIASGRAIITSLAAHPSKLFQIDELGLFLREVCNSKAPAHKAAIKSEFMKLFSRAKGVYLGTEYADQRERKREDIHEPNACLYGVTTPSTFWDALEGGALQDGFVARLLVFQTDNNRPPRNPDCGGREPPQALLDGLRRIAAGRGGLPQPGGNLAQAGVPVFPPHDPSKPGTTYTVPMTPDAEALHADWEHEEDALARVVEGTFKSTIVNRWAENALKLAMIRAISDNPQAPLICKASLDWGWKLARRSMDTILRDADERVSSNENEKFVKQLKKIIRDAGTVTMTDLCKRSEHIRKETRNSIIDDFVQQGLVTVARDSPAGRGRPKTVYLWNESVAA